MRFSLQAKQCPGRALSTTGLARPAVAFVLALILMPAQAQAQYYGMGGYGGYGYGYPMSPSVVMLRQPQTLVHNQQYYNVTISGLEAICQDSPESCVTEEQTTKLVDMRHEQTTAYILQGIGLALLVAAPVVLFAVTCSDNSPFCTKNTIPAAVLGAAGVGLSITGSIFHPSERDYLDWINLTNRLHPDEPIRLQFGARPGRGLEVMASGSF